MFCWSNDLSKHLDITVIFYPCSSVNIKVDTSFVIQVFQVFSVPVKIWGHQKIRGQIDFIPNKKKRETLSLLRTVN